MILLGRRKILTIASSLLVLANLPSPARANVIAELLLLAELLEKMANAITKFGDSIAHLAKLGTQGYDAIAARAAYSELLELRAGLVQLVSQWNRPLIQDINEYVEKARSPGGISEHVLQTHWFFIIRRVKGAALKVKALLENIDNIRSDFVLQEYYVTIQNSLDSRITLFDKLELLPAPKSTDDLDALSKAGAEYQKLSDATQKASGQLASYIAAMK